MSQEYHIWTDYLEQSVKRRSYAGFGMRNAKSLRGMFIEVSEKRNSVV
jgi:hypothetical protein